jgi:hypothetical protein
MPKGRSEEALQSLTKLRRLPTRTPRVKLEHLDIQAKVHFHKELSAEWHPQLGEGNRAGAIKLGIVFRKGCWRRTQVGLVTMFFQHK